MNYLEGGADHDATGPMGQCVACGETKRMHAHFAEGGWACRSCFLSASTVIEVRWIKGQKFTRCLKGLAPKTKPATSLQAAGFRKES